ncbi:response regulator transcription factor [Marinomonas posidonica]|uniref:Two component transcriptional regulator, winged helix family n=1 Tax=Marinomonas posidonica (strain CECT 7376 / NCIMB 14433 / IVIA-Po-181) TaxID=491952 RepID=F6CVP9_MARPP|nr:response regulator transcription factor [Marinomonas posidonica]AEF56523.1 two component transcriptional regulator, winged helix family [Marinomonas posidonica IVIA-Po-181]
MRMLLIEDNQGLAESIQVYFRNLGEPIDWVNSVEQAENSLSFADFDLLILDINLPGKSGFQLLQSLRASGNRLSVLMLTARTEVDDRVSSLDFGADDYLAKPFDFRELAARCRALYRRERGEVSNEVQCGNLHYNLATHSAFVEGKLLDLRPRERQLLDLFLHNLDRVLTKDDISNRLYHYDEAYTPNAIEQTLTRLRKHLDGSSLIIKTIRGLGYLAHVDD